MHSEGLFGLGTQKLSNCLNLPSRLSAKIHHISTPILHLIPLPYPAHFPPPLFSSQSPPQIRPTSQTLSRPISAFSPVRLAVQRTSLGDGDSPGIPPAFCLLLQPMLSRAHLPRPAFGTFPRPAAAMPPKLAAVAPATPAHEQAKTDSPIGQGLGPKVDWAGKFRGN